MKPRNAITLKREAKEFPRYKKRGPIEACPFCAIPTPIQKFPRYKKRGPIEASFNIFLSRPP